MYVFCIALVVLTIIIFKVLFKINFKKMKELDEYNGINTITNKFDNNINIANEMLTMLANKSVLVEENKDIKSSFYFVLTNKISIANLNNNYARIQTIAHECLHSVQDKALLLFNFFFSNFCIIYFFVISILTLFNKIQNSLLHVFILTLLGLIQFSIRSFLEIDAMTKSKYLAKQYIEDKKILSEEESQLVLKQYEKINKQAIPFVIDNLLFTILIRILVYIIFSLI